MSAATVTTAAAVTAAARRFCRLRRPGDRTKHQASEAKGQCNLAWCNLAG
jgi:hypothetical protein